MYVKLHKVVYEKLGFLFGYKHKILFLNMQGFF